MAEQKPAQKPQVPVNQSQEAPPTKPPPPDNITIKASHTGTKYFAPTIESPPPKKPD